MDINTPFKKYEYKYYYVFVDSYSCEFSKENCTMEQLNSKTMTWIIKEAEGSKYGDKLIYHVCHYFNVEICLNVCIRTIKVIIIIKIIII